MAQGAYIFPLIDVSDPVAVDAIRSRIPVDGTDGHNWVAQVGSSADGKQWYIPKAGDPYPAISGVPDFFLMSCTVTLVAGQVTVALPSAIPDADYRVSIGALADESFYISHKFDASFKVHSSDSSSVSQVDVIVTRQTGF